MEDLDLDDKFENRRLIKTKFHNLIKDIPEKKYKDFLIIFDHIDRLFSFEQSNDINYLLFRKSKFFSLGGTILLIFDKNKTISFNFSCIKTFELEKPSESSFINFVKLNYGELHIDNLSRFDNFNDLKQHIKFIKSKNE